MRTVREATIELLRERGMTTLFGNPGSTELPMLADFPEDFRYILGLQEAVAVGMADGYAQASGGPSLVNLHTAPGLGNGMGAIFNAQANKSPVVVTAGQQYRSLMTLQANLTNRDATRMPHPLVKWSYEPPCAQDVPHALARATHLAGLAPRGPVFVSIPMDDWYAEVRSEEEVRHQTTRAVSGASAPDHATIAELARRLREAANPAFVAGPDIDAAGGWDAAVRFAEAARLPVYATPATGGGRLGFPEDHALFQAILPPSVQPLGEVLAPHDFVLAVGTSIFPYYPNIPGPLLSEGTSLTAITSDPDEAARAPMGDAIVADVALTLAALADAVSALGDPGREPPPVRAAPAAMAPSDPMSPSTAVRTLAQVFPEDGIVVLESPVGDAGAAQPAAPEPAGELLLLGWRRPGLRDAGVDRRAAGVPAAPGRVRARRGLGAVRGAELLDGGGLQSPGDLPGAAQRRVRDPEVLLAAGGGPGRAGPGPAGARHAGRRGGLRRQRAARGRRGGARRGAAPRAGLGRPGADRGPGRAGHVAGVSASPRRSGAPSQ